MARLASSLVFASIAGLAACGGATKATEDHGHQAGASATAQTGTGPAARGGSGATLGAAGAAVGAGSGGTSGGIGGGATLGGVGGGATLGGVGGGGGFGGVEVAQAGAFGGSVTNFGGNGGNGPGISCSTTEVGGCVRESCTFTGGVGTALQLPFAFAPITARVLTDGTELQSTWGPVVVKADGDPNVMIQVASGWTRVPTAFSAGQLLRVTPVAGGAPFFERTVAVPATVELTVSHAEYLPFKIPNVTAGPATSPTGTSPELHWAPQAEGELHYVWRTKFQPDLHGSSVLVHCQAPLADGFLQVDPASISTTAAGGGIYLVRRSATGDPEAAAATVVFEVSAAP